MTLLFIICRFASNYFALNILWILNYRTILQSWQVGISQTAETGLLVETPYFRWSGDLLVSLVRIEGQAPKRYATNSTNLHRGVFIHRARENGVQTRAVKTHVTALFSAKIFRLYVCNYCVLRACFHWKSVFQAYGMSSQIRRRLFDVVNSKYR